MSTKNNLIIITCMWSNMEPQIYKLPTYLQYEKHYPSSLLGVVPRIISQPQGWTSTSIGTFTFLSEASYKVAILKPRKC